jgi:hypothetical protein
MTKTEIEQAKAKAVKAYQRRNHVAAKMTPFEQVLYDVGTKTFAEGFDAAVKAMKR